jgi:phosphate acetyltransferase
MQIGDDRLERCVRRDGGLETSGASANVFVLDVTAYPRPLLISDADVNISPTLEEKVDTMRNAIDLARVLHIDEPKTAILSAVETVTPKIASTIDAAALCKMADRCQIVEAIVEERSR